MTEQYSIGYTDGHQDGYNKALDECVLEINALKAQVNRLRIELGNAHDFLLRAGIGSYVVRDIDKALEATKEQCMVKVKAKAVEDVITEVTKQGSGMQINVTPYFYDYRVLKFINELNEHAKQLREQAKW